MNLEAIASTVVDTAYHLHEDLGPGLLESVYEAILARQLIARGLQVERQVPVTFTYQGLAFDEGFRLDLLVNKSLVVELKSVDSIVPLHFKQLLTYLRLLDQPLGLVLNFGAATFKEGVRRVVNDHRDTTGSELRVHQPGTTFSFR